MSNLNIALHLVSNRKSLELNSLSFNNAYDLRSAQIKINWKYEVIVEALESLYALGIEHSCNLSELIANFDAIAPSQR